MNTCLTPASKLSHLRHWRHMLAVTAVMASTAGCGPTGSLKTDESETLAQMNQGGKLVVEWNEKALDSIRGEKTPPPAAVRALAIMHGAMYDAHVAITGRGKPYLYQSNDKVRGSAAVAVSAAAATVLGTLYPNQNTLAPAAIGNLIGSVTAQELGRAAARAYLQARSQDLEIARQAPGESPAVAPGVWRPTLPAQADYLLPGCGNMKPWVAPVISSVLPVAPLALDSAAYAEQMNETKRLGGKNSTERTADQTEIASFWADGAGTATPPGHWNMIAQGLVASQNMGLADSLKMFTALNFAMADAAISAWDAKWKFHVWRPITAIREADTDGNDATEADASWEPLLATPPFPAYVSGHSTFSGAGAAVLNKFFKGRNIPFSTTSDAMPGVTRSFKSFDEAANEAGRSRIYGGIHFEMDNSAGLAAGKQVADMAFQRLGF